MNEGIFFFIMLFKKRCTVLFAVCDDFEIWKGVLL